MFSDLSPNHSPRSAHFYEIMNSMFPADEPTKRPAPCVHHDVLNHAVQPVDSIYDWSVAPGQEPTAPQAGDAQSSGSDVLSEDTGTSSEPESVPTPESPKTPEPASPGPLLLEPLLLQNQGSDRAQAPSRVTPAFTRQETVSYTHLTLPTKA